MPDTPSAEIQTYRALLEVAANCFAVQAETARQYAKHRDAEANLGLARELDRHATVIRQTLEHYKRA